MSNSNLPTVSNIPPPTNTSPTHYDKRLRRGHASLVASVPKSIVPMSSSIPILVGRRSCYLSIGRNRAERLRKLRLRMGKHGSMLPHQHRRIECYDHCTTHALDWVMVMDAAMDDQSIPQSVIPVSQGIQHGAPRIVHNDTSQVEVR